MQVFSRNSGHSLRAEGGPQPPAGRKSMLSVLQLQGILHHNWKRLGSRLFPNGISGLDDSDAACEVLMWESAKNLLSISQTSDSGKLLINVCCSNWKNLWQFSAKQLITHKVPLKATTHRS